MHLFTILLKLNIRLGQITCSRAEASGAVRIIFLESFSRFAISLPCRETITRNIEWKSVLLEESSTLNRQINQTLEQIAQAIFKSWFVDFEPVKAKQHLRALGGNDEQTERAAQAVIAGAVNLDLITTATDLSALDQQLIRGAQ